MYIYIYVTYSYEHVFVDALFKSNNPVCLHMASRYFPTDQPCKSQAFPRQPSEHRPLTIRNHLRIVQT